MRILIKIGSALISSNNRIHYRWLKSKVREIAGLHRGGHEIVLVSSGAVAAGMEIEGLTERPRDTLQLQLLSGVGQIKLMKYYKDYFKPEHIRVAQILLTHHNFSSRSEETTIRTIIDAYLARGVVPVVNENDMINKEEVEFKPVFSDNDILAALVAVRARVDLLLILTDVDGLFRANPKRNAHVEFIHEVRAIDGQIEAMAAREANPMGLGGMASKVEAAKMAAAEGIATIVSNGRYPLGEILARRVRRTLFCPSGGMSPETAAWLAPTPGGAATRAACPAPPQSLSSKQT
jgi:glutamate 5-kinase